MNTELAIEIAAAMCRRWEGLYLTPYLCPAGIPTIGYGATYYEDGRSVTLQDPPITKERAEALLIWMIRKKYLPSVIDLCPGIDNSDRLAAIIDFTFNLGSSRLRSSTLRKRINQGRWDEVPTELMKWNKAGGRVLHGLTRRRKIEAGLC